jgi:L-fucose dehydrogenase
MNLHLQNKVILVVAGAEDRDAAIIRLLVAEGAIPCFILTDPDFCVKMVEEMVRRYGRIDGVVNTLAPNDRISLEHGGYIPFLQAIEQHTLYAWLVLETVKPLLQASGGAIVNLISYATGAGVRMGLTAAWAEELKDQGIRVNGIVVTENPAPLGRRRSTEEEIAETVAFLLSGAAAGMQGELVYVDGGYVHLGRELDTST